MVYVSPSEMVDGLILWSKSFYLCCLILDFNGHSHLWGANEENECGKVVQHLIDNRHDLILWPFILVLIIIIKRAPLLYLYVILLYMYMDIACEVSSDRLGSDHHPTVITANTSGHPVREGLPKWNFKKAKWDNCIGRCTTEIIPDLSNDAEYKMVIFSTTLLDVAAHLHEISDLVCWPWDSNGVWAPGLRWPHWNLSYTFCWRNYVHARHSLQTV